jgi:hypothetical protein
MRSPSILYRSRSILAALGAVAVVACTEPTAPVPNAGAATYWRSGGGSYGPRTTAPTFAAPAAAAAPTFLKFASWAGQLETYNTSFPVTVGSASSFTVNFKNSPFPFMRIEIPANADFFGATGLPLKNGTRVTVTVAIDPIYATVRFGPHGTLFTQQNPAKLYLNYYALDLGGKLPDQLAIWYQPDPTIAWSAQATDIDVSWMWLIIPLFHFSDYAIAY